MNDHVIASTKPRPASSAARAARAPLHLGQHRARDAVPARHRRRRHVVEAGDAHDLLDDIGRAMHVGPPCRHRHLDRLALALDGEAERLQRLRALRLGQLEPGELLHAREGERDDRLLDRRLARDPAPSTASPPATSSIMRVARSRPGSMKAGSTPRSKR